MMSTHKFHVPAPVDQVWATFNHLELVASCFPGATLMSVNGHAFSGSVKVKLGTTTLVYSGAGQLEERHLGGRHTVLTADGVERRGKGTVEAKITTTFGESGDGTLVTITSRLSFTGTPATLAPEVVQEAGDRLTAQFADAITARFVAGVGRQALDADPAGATDLGRADGSGRASYTFQPPPPASQNDYEVLARLASTWTRRLAPALVGGLVVVWLVRRVSRG